MPTSVETNGKGHGRVAPSVCIIGVGFSGMCAAIKLRRDLGLDNFDIFESNKEVGGTWFMNKYPGCSCDIPIQGYSYSFEKRSDWRAQYASNDEIHKYMKEVAGKYDLYSRIHFEHSVKRLEWDTTLQKWTVTIEDLQKGKVFVNKYDIVLSATGSIRVPKVPEEFHGFKGPIIHTAMWDDTVDLKDKNVGVVGTGASGIQVIPQLAKVAKKLIVFQRKPSWIFPKYDFEFPSVLKFFFTYIPGLLYLYQMILFYTFESVWFGMKKNSRTSKICTSICNWHRRRQLGNREDLYNLLTPEYDFGCQRTGFASDYFPVFTKPSTSLVTQKIDHVTPNSVCTSDGQEHPIDVLVLATGYRITDYFAPMEIFDKNGDNVLTSWKKDAPSLFMGIASSNLPNLFVLYGPNTSTGHNSVVITVEMQMNWVIGCLREMLSQNVGVVVIKDSVEKAYMAELHHQLKSMVWSASLCSPWYTDEQGRNVSIFPWTLHSFWKRVNAFDYRRQMDFHN